VLSVWQLAGLIGEGVKAKGTSTGTGTVCKAHNPHQQIGGVAYGVGNLPKRIPYYLQAAREINVREK
jgi:hypothetical protein